MDVILTTKMVKIIVLINKNGNRLDKKLFRVYMST